MNTYLNLPAPAKLNLFLHVTGRKSDGMHLLESIFVLIDLCDQIDLEELPSGAIERVGDIEWDVEKDLCGVQQNFFKDLLLKKAVELQFVNKFLTVPAWAEDLPTPRPV